MLRQVLLASCALAIGCHHEPPPKAASPELPVGKPSDLAGRWVMSDDMDFGYHLSIDASGNLVQTIDRGHLGTCTQDAPLAAPAGGKPRVFALTWVHDTCDDGGRGAKRSLEVVSRTKDALEVIEHGGVSDVHRRYTPDPQAGSGAGSGM